MRAFLLFIMLCFTGTLLFAQSSRPVTDTEKAFVKKVEQRMSQLLTGAAKTMTGNWRIEFKADKSNQEQVNTLQHDGKPHEFMCSLSMEYIATPAEKTAMDAELATYFKNQPKKETDAGSRLNDPSLKYSIEVTAIINPYSFTPVDVQQVSTPGGTINVPGSVLTMFRNKELGTGAPYYSLYLGDYTLVNENGKQLLKENFGKSADCTNARTLLIEVHSNPAVADLFISKLNLTAFNRIIQDL